MITLVHDIGLQHSAQFLNILYLYNKEFPGPITYYLKMFEDDLKLSNSSVFTFYKFMGSHK